MSKWTCANCGVEVFGGLKTCACATMVMVENGGLGRSQWMHHPIAPTDLELAVLACNTLEDFRAVQKTVAVLPAAHLNGPDSSMVEPGYQRPGFDSPSGPPSPPHTPTEAADALASIRAERDMAERAAVEAAIPLEALLMAGQGPLSDAVWDGVRNGVGHVRSMLKARAARAIAGGQKNET